MLKHRFKHTCYNIDELFEGTTTVSMFMNRVKKQSKRNPDLWEPETYLGDGFEILVESVILQFGSDKRICIRDYTPIMESDLGVDGFGYGPGGEIHTVQCKARSDATSVLSANRDHLSNFVAHSHSKFGGESKVKYMTIFTTASGMHHVTNEMYNGEVRVIGYQELRALLDNNEMFWVKFREQMKFGK